METEYIISLLTYVFLITAPMAYEFNKRDSMLRKTKDIALMRKLHRECCRIFITWLVMIIGVYIILL